MPAATLILHHYAGSPFAEQVRPTLWCITPVPRPATCVPSRVPASE